MLDVESSMLDVEWSRMSGWRGLLDADAGWLHTSRHTQCAPARQTLEHSDIECNANNQRSVVACEIKHTQLPAFHNMWQDCGHVHVVARSFFLSGGGSPTWTPHFPSSALIPQVVP
eukprot:1654522-Rhodomonas_salina.3